MIFRIDEVLIPPTAPIMADNTTLIKMILVLNILLNTYKGATFCHVDKIKISIHLKLVIISGNHL